MLEGLPADVQVYIGALATAVAVPLVVVWILYKPLTHFLRSIFHDAKIEQFWIRVVLLIYLAWALSAGLGYQPDESVAVDEVALIWNVADQLHNILSGLLWATFALFLPLLLSYTILHAGRPRPQGPAPREKAN